MVPSAAQVLRRPSEEFHLGTTFRVSQDQIAKYVTAIKAAKSDDEFQAWFNKADDARHAQFNGFWDFAVHIATPAVRFHLDRPHEKTALEIGCGGGRLLGAASHYFGRVIGLDIHDDLDRVRQHLASRGINAEVIRGDGETIPLPDQSVDFVYSFIVLQHLQSFAAFQSYLRETRRVCRGVAQLYYGKRESLLEREGPANTTTLAMSRDDAVNAAVHAGFEVLDEGESWRFGEPALRRGYQGYMLLR